MARISRRYSHIIDYKEMHDLLIDFQNRVYEDKAKKMPYTYWRDIIKSTADDRALFEIEWENEKDGVLIDIFYDNNRVAWSFNTGDNSFGDFIYKNLLFGVENKMRREYSSDYYTDNKSCQYYDYYDSRTGKSTVYEELATKAEIYDLERVNDTINKLCESATLAAPLKNENNNNKTNKESFSMKFNFDFGPVNPATVRMSLYGLAVKNKAGTWVSYDTQAGDIMDVDILNFDGAKFLYKMPVATKDITIGDVVIHNGIPMFVIAIATSGAYITVVDPINGERKDIMLPKSPFGFNFATKVVNFLGNLNTGADASNPFGNLGLMLMLNDSGDMNDLLPLILMTGNSGLDMSNPLMLYALLSKDSKSNNDNILPMLMMLNAQHPVSNVPSQGCSCGGHCTDNSTQR